MTESLDTLAERIDGIREGQEEMTQLLRTHIADDRSQFAEIRVALAGLESTVRTEMSRREGHSSAIAALEQSRVTNEKFEPVRNVVYGVAGMILIGFFAALIAWVMNHK